MAHDVETVIDRSRSGSVKWDAMRKIDPGVPAGIVPLSIGDMELRNPHELIAGLKDYLDRNVLGYTCPTQAYYGAVRDWFRRRHGWEIDSEWLVGFDGVVPAMYAAVRACTLPGDGVIFMPPIYHPMFDAVENAGRRPVPVPLLNNNGDYSMDFARLESAAASPEVKLILFCSPHNPVARVWNREELTRLGEICLKHKVLVLSDEIHMDFAMPEHRHTVFAALSPELAANCIVCTAPTKTFNIAGLQVSNIVIPNPEIRLAFCNEYAKGGRFGVNQIGLAACRIAYERCEGWLDAVLELVHANAELVRSFMAEHFPEIVVSPHEGTYFIWLDFRAWKLKAKDLERRMVEKAHLFLDGGYNFGEGGAGFERINLACPRRILEDALERLLAAGRP